MIAVFGARPKSLGAGIARTLNRKDQEVLTFGMNEEDYFWRWPETQEVDLGMFSDVVVTLGVNYSDEEDPTGRIQMEVNYFALMHLARMWQASQRPGHFVVISSNSSSIARSRSAGYCASKAALSMGIRALARSAEPGVFYGWEFGLLQGTPMTQAVAARLGAGAALSRIPGAPEGLTVAACAGHVARAIISGGRELNGCMLRIDGGDS